MSRRISFRVHGDVQGVGFRYFTRKQATAHGVTGWVRNTSNNEVEGEAQGDDEVLQKFLADIHKGPSHATVEKVDKSDIEIKDGENGFHVKHST